MNAAGKTGKRLLDPIERISEVLFGLIMALSFTCAISAAEAGTEEVRTVMVGALGCNIAWGLIDAIIYLVSNLTQRAHDLATLRALHRTEDPGQARDIISAALPPVVADAMAEGDLDRLRQKLNQISDLPGVPRLGKDDFLAAAGIFLLVFLATFPVVIPFIVMNHALEAMRVSNAIALVMLFLAGYSLGHYARHRPWRMGVGMMLLGSALVVITIVLGG